MVSQGSSGGDGGLRNPNMPQSFAYDRNYLSKENPSSVNERFVITSSENGYGSSNTNEMESKENDQISEEGSCKERQEQQKYTGNGSNRKVQSLKMRKLPVSVLLKPSVVDNTSQISEDLENQHDPVPSTRPRDYIRRLCLRPGFTIRTQLMLSFGTINAITGMVVVSVCIAAAVLAGENIKRISKLSFEEFERESQVRSAQYLARSLDQRLFPEDEINILREIVYDRFMGYPESTDDYVPFLDMESGRRIYPVIGSPMPLDWELYPNVDVETYEEHFQGRSFWKNHLDVVSTLNAGFMMQGSCDSSIDDRTDPRYWPVCTEANNDISTGGVVAPSPQTVHIHRKGSDIVPVLKALFESKEEMRDLGVYFANEGAGAGIIYPQTLIDTSWTYVSTGCKWMNKPHPYNFSRTIGTQEMIDRCHGVSETVSARAYNALETEWCARQALNPEKMVVSIALDKLEDNQSWLLSAGKAVYDRLTEEFVGCTYVGISLLEIEDELTRASTITDKSEVSIVMYNELGTVIASSKEGLASKNLPVYEADLGITKESYNRLYSLVDFESRWTPDEAVAKYENFESTDGPFLVSAYPIPPIPESYDPTYRPLSFAVMSTAVDELFSVVQEVNDGVDGMINDLVLLSILVGAIGLALATIVIFCMSHLLTKPLNSMNDVANEIVNNFGDSTKEGEISAPIQQKMVGLRCSPRTELDDVVREFNKMVATFSGKMVAKSETGRVHEVMNQLGLRRDLYDLYMARADEDFKYAVEPPDKLATTSKMLRSGDKMNFSHRGSNLLSCATTSTNTPSTAKQPLLRKWSPLFLWIVGLIVTPLLLANITISAVVVQKLSVSFKDSVEQAEGFFLDVQRRALWIHSLLRADYLSSLTRQSSRDAFLLARYSSWLLFGGLTRSETFTEASTGTEACKTYTEDLEDCPYVEEHFVCDCAWEEYRTDLPCMSFLEGSRHLQVPYWLSESHAALEDGDRASTLYPEASFSPETTAYWENPLLLPGWERGSNASGHDFSYDRLRSISALPLLQVIYNREAIQDYLIATFISFEADGLMFGYRGCSTAYQVRYAHYRISADDITETRPDICPEGKYGYDPRCRQWYDKGRRMAIENSTYLHVTSPYSFATTLTIAQTTTTPLIDPITAEHVGQILVDFYADPLYNELSHRTFFSSNGFPFLISSQSDNDFDTVMAPGFYQNISAPPIGKQILPNDFPCDRSHCTKNVDLFNSLVAAMKDGRDGFANFERTRSDRKTETIHMGYAPVVVKSYRPIDSSDISRGVQADSYLVYSVALAEPETDMLEPFDPVESEIQAQIRAATVVLCVLISLSTLLVAYFSHKVASSISSSMVYLLDLVRLINTQENTQPPPHSQDRVNASREVTMLSESMEILFTLLRSANAAFYAGELELAHSILLDALRLFKRLGNRKAVGIASNNLGNVVFAMYQHMKAHRQHVIGGRTRLQIVRNGVGYYLTAIRLGEELSDEFHDLQGWSPACLEFTQHLANRYFNRGLFLLIAKDDHKSPAELEELGRRDLRIAGDMDEEVISYGEEIRWDSPDRVEKAFEVKIARARGYNLLLKHGYEDEWNIQNVLDDAFDMIKVAKSQESSSLFASMSIAGRMQILEIELMKYKLLTGDIEIAAKIAVRMILEDELVFSDAQWHAVDVLLQYIDERHDIDESSRAKLRRNLTETRLSLEEAAEDQLLASMNDFGSVVSSRTSSANNSRASLSQTWSMRQSGWRFFTMEDF